MKRTILSLSCVAILSLVAVWIASGVNPCIDHISAGPWQCAVPGSITSHGALNWTTRTICPGETITAPVLFTSPAVGLGRVRQRISHSCPEYQNQNHWETNAFFYSL